MDFELAYCESQTHSRPQLGTARSGVCNISTMTCTLLSHIAYISGPGEVGAGGDCNGSHGGSNRSRVLELLERNRKVARSDGLYQFVLWREALRGTAGMAGKDEEDGGGSEV